MTTNKLADTFLLDLENLSDDSDNETKKIPEKIDNKEIKLDYMGKKKLGVSVVVSTTSTKILESANSQLINNSDYLNLKKSIIDDEKNNINIIPATLSKGDKM